MKNLKSFSMLIITALILLSCSSGDDSGTDIGPTTDNGNWRLGNFEYSAGVTELATNNSIVALVATTENDNSQGSASGSAVAFSFYDLGPGAYKIVKSIGTTENQGTQVISISCTIGTASVNASRYDSSEETGGIATIIQEDGTYNISVSDEVILFKTVDVGEGVPNAEESYPFTANGIE